MFRLLQERGDDGGVVEVFEGMNTGAKRFGGVVGGYRAVCLQDYVAAIHLVVNIMDGDAALPLSGFEHRAVHIHPPHAATAEFG